MEERRQATFSKLQTNFVKQYHTQASRKDNNKSAEVPERQTTSNKQFGVREGKSRELNL